MVRQLVTEAPQLADASSISASTPLPVASDVREQSSVVRQHAVEAPQLTGDASDGVGADRPPETHSGLPGRPTAKQLYLAEFERRAGADEVLVTISGETQALREWFMKQHLTLAASEVRSIENHIREPYRRYRNEPNGA